MFDAIWYIIFCSILFAVSYIAFTIYVATRKTEKSSYTSDLCELNRRVCALNQDLVEMNMRILGENKDLLLILKRDIADIREDTLSIMQNLVGEKNG